jgi:hypothetical protein
MLRILIRAFVYFINSTEKKENKKPSYCESEAEIMEMSFLLLKNLNREKVMCFLKRLILSVSFSICLWNKF